MTIVRMIVAAIFFVWGGLCHAGDCDWDIEILEMEARKHAEWFDVLVGQDDQHGEAYYRYQVEQLSSKSKLSMDERLELAIAYLEVGEYLLSKDILVGIISEDPEFAPAIFYRGIVAERSGDYELAEVYLLRDLDIDRDGYLGVGNWYLELMRRKLNPSSSNYGEVDFVEGWESYRALGHEDYVDRLITLVRFDPSFVEGYYLIGKALDTQETCHLAQIAFARAERESKFYLAPEGIWSTAKYMRSLDEKLDREAPPTTTFLANGERWRKAYAQQEKILANQGIAPSFKNMKSKTEIYDMKNQFSNTEFDGKWAVVLFVLSVVSYGGYSYYRSRNS